MRTRIMLKSTDRCHVMNTAAGIDAVLYEDDYICIEKFIENKWQEIACHQLKHNEKIMIRSNMLPSIT